MATKFQSSIQVELGEELALWNNHYRASQYGVGRVISVNQRGCTVEILESTSNLPWCAVGKTLRFNLNTYTDMLILQERGKQLGTGTTARRIRVNA